MQKVVTGSTGRRTQEMTLAAGTIARNMGQTLWSIKLYLPGSSTSHLLRRCTKRVLQLHSSADYSQVPPETASLAMSRLGAIETVIVLVILVAAVHPGEL